MLALIEQCKVDTQKVYLYSDFVKYLQSAHPNEAEEYGKKNLELEIFGDYTKMP